MFDKWQEDSKVLDVHKEWIKTLLLDGHKLMSTIASLKHEWNFVKAENDEMCKSPGCSILK